MITQDGTVINIADHRKAESKVLTSRDGYVCQCHRMMGNEFYFLPYNQCLKADGICDKLEGIE